MKKFILFIILFSPFFCLSQMENTQWRFSTQCGLSFTTNPPAFVSSVVNSGGGSCSSIADASGNLLFYTNGLDVWNRYNTPMAGTNTPLIGGGTTQGVLIAKQPGNNPYYYIFVTGASGLRYSIVDMSLASGAGSVTVKNVTLTTQAQAYKIAGTRHCNKSDIWITSQDQASSWRTYLLTSTGVSAPVVSNTGHAHVVYAAMKFSPDGSKIASTEWGDGVYLYDFNNSTGAVSGMTVVSGQGFAAWGVEFSPDGKKLYATRSYATLFQWDLTAGSATAIAASMYSVYVTPTSVLGNQGALQLAPDGKIYQSYGNAQILSIINNPNGLGAACSYSYGALNLAPKYSGYGLPNQVKPALPLASFTSAISQASCQTIQFGPITSTVGGINSVFPAAVNWIFGDPSSGSANNSSQLNPVHLFSAPGTYTVKMLLANLCGPADTVSKVVNVPNNASTLSFSGNTLICMGVTTSLSVNGASSYTWNSALGQATGAAIVVNPLSSVVFTVSANTVNSCTTYSTLSVSVLPPSVFSVSGNTQLCVGDSTTLTASGVSNYTWTSTSGPIGTTSVLSFSPPQGILTYTLSGFNPTLSCVGQLLITLTVSPYPALVVSGPSMVCVGEAVSLVASGASNYTWSSSAGTLNGAVLTTTLLTAQNFTVSAGNPTNSCISKTVVSVGVDACLGLSSYKPDDFKVYPNPFAETLRINSAMTFRFKIYDLQGRFMLSGRGYPGENSIDLSSLKEGSYFLAIHSPEGVFYRQVVKLVSH